MARKKFRDTTVGKLIFGAADLIVPGVGKLLSGAGSVAQVIDGINESSLSPEQKLELRIKVLEIEEKELERDVVAQQEVTKRWISDNNAGALTRYVRPSLLITLTVLLLAFTFLDSSDRYDFSVEDKWVEMWSYLTGIAFGAYFLGKSAEKTFKK